jgi:hypothetical protein
MAARATPSVDHVDALIAVVGAERRGEILSHWTDLAGRRASRL